MASDPQKPNVRYVPSQTIEEGWTYVSIPDDETVLGLRLAVTKVMKMLKSDNTPAIDGNGNPIYTYNSVPVVRVLTKEEYEVEKKRGFLK